MDVGSADTDRADAGFLPDSTCRIDGARGSSCPAGEVCRGTGKGSLEANRGKEVIRQGDFVAHPLVGGVGPEPDESSPFSQASVDGAGNLVVRFDDEGTYPCFCELHSSSMKGVVFVIP